MKKILITAGPTRELIDPIRYISNGSSGKMGYAIANEFSAKGADVKLISGPVSFKGDILSFARGVPLRGCHCKDPDASGDVAVSLGTLSVQTAEEMYQAVLKSADWADIIIMAAAVADYRPVEVAPQKIKKESDILTLQLEKTPDILADLGQNKKNGQVLVGFALETENLLQNAQQKLKEKNLDLVIANNEKAIGSNSADFFIVDKDGYKELKQVSKQQLANILVEKLMNVGERFIPSRG